jgi:hypothetical protein
MTGPWNILRHVNIWSAVTRKDGDGGGGGGNDNDSGSSSKGKFEDSRSELEAKGYTVSDDGKSVYNDNGQVASEGWSGSRTVDDIVSGGGGGGGGDSGGGQSFREAFAAARASKRPRSDVYMERPSLHHQHCGGKNRPPRMHRQRPTARLYSKPRWKRTAKPAQPQKLRL